MARKPQKLRIPKNWTFEAPAVAKAFDSHVREQLPWYTLATGIVAHIVRAYLPFSGVVLDVGASTGNIGRAIEPTLKARTANLRAFDASWAMANEYKGPGDFEVAHAEDYDYAACAPDVIVCFLSLMFVSIADRAPLIARMHASLHPGGVLIVFDKTVPRPGYIGTVAYRLALAAKHENGARAEEILAKELSLSGVQRPLSDAELADFVEVFRFGDFAGFVREA